MLTIDNIKKLKEFDTETVDSQLLRKILNYEKKFKTNSLKFYAERVKYTPRLKEENDLKEFLDLTKKYLDKRYDWSLLNKFEKMELIVIIGDKRKEIEKILDIENSFVLLNDDYKNLDKMIYLAKIKNNYVFVFTDDEKKTEKYLEDRFVQVVITPKKHKKNEMYKLATKCLIIDNCTALKEIQKFYPNIKEEIKKDQNGLFILFFLYQLKVYRHQLIYNLSIQQM